MGIHPKEQRRRTLLQQPPRRPCTVALPSGLQIHQHQIGNPTPDLGLRLGFRTGSDHAVSMVFEKGNFFSEKLGVLAHQEKRFEGPFRNRVFCLFFHSTHLPEPPSPVSPCEKHQERLPTWRYYATVCSERGSWGEKEGTMTVYRAPTSTHRRSNPCGCPHQGRHKACPYRGHEESPPRSDSSGQARVPAPTPCTRARGGSVPQPRSFVGAPLVGAHTRAGSPPLGIGPPLLSNQLRVRPRA